ncbi:trans-sialidase [Trypanosoma cruzi]|nr:trans-sialidase [Trypanosoma cruzi]
MRPVNTRGDNVRHVSLSHNFTLVVSVTIEETPSGNTPPLTAMLADTASNHTVGLSCSHNKKWETAFEGNTTTRSSTWEPKEEYQVSLMLQGNKASVHIDGHSLGEEEVPLTGEKPPEGSLWRVRWARISCDGDECLSVQPPTEFHCDPCTQGQGPRSDVRSGPDATRGDSSS